MRQSQLFTKTERNAPQDEIALNAQLLARGGFVYKNSAGVYSFLPLGWRVIQKITQIVREEMNAIGGVEMFMPALIDKKYMEMTGRWDISIDFQTKSRYGGEFALGWTHEELLTEVVTKYISSYRDLPFSAYQIQTKFRDEKRPKSGILRGREFMMKDLYSFHQSQADLDRFYEKVAKAYAKIFERCGFKAIYTLAAGGDFTKSYTHEFQVLAPVGEDTIFLCEKCDYAENQEISELKDDSGCTKCGGKIKEAKAIEVGNIFPLGTKFSEAFDLKFLNEKGEKELVVMGSYGIGIGRLMGTAVELFHDDHGIIWPKAIAPFAVHLIELEGGKGEEIYHDLQKRGVEVLYDERTLSAGEKFADADLLGIPVRLVTSAKTGEKLELKLRNESEVKLMTLDELSNQL